MILKTFLRALDIKLKRIPVIKLKTALNNITGILLILI